MFVRRIPVSSVTTMKINAMTNFGAGSHVQNPLEQAPSPAKDFQPHAIQTRDESYSSGLDKQGSHGWKCPSCGWGNSSMDKYCIGCGYVKGKPN